jgi:hypothetical protein
MAAITQNSGRGQLLATSRHAVRGRLSVAFWGKADVRPAIYEHTPKSLMLSSPTIRSLIPGLRLMQRGGLEPDLVNPLFQQRHREAFAVAFRNCLDFMPKQRPPIIDGATGGSQSVLRAMPQAMDYFALITRAAGRRAHIGGATCETTRQRAFEAKQTASAVRHRLVQR